MCASFGVIGMPSRVAPRWAAEKCVQATLLHSLHRIAIAYGFLHRFPLGNSCPISVLQDLLRCDGLARHLGDHGWREHPCEIRVVTGLAAAVPASFPFGKLLPN